MSSTDPIIKTRQTEKEVNGISTQVVCTEFSNYILVVLTQYGKMGTLISVTPDSRSNDISKPTFTTKILLGKDEPLTHVCAKNLATFVSQEAGNKPVLLGLALKDSSIDSIRHMKEIIKSCQVWQEINIMDMKPGGLLKYRPSGCPQCHIFLIVILFLN